MDNVTSNKNIPVILETFFNRISSTPIIKPINNDLFPHISKIFKLILQTIVKKFAIDQILCVFASPAVENPASQSARTAQSYTYA